MPIAVTMVIGVVLLVLLSRLDHRMARSQFWRVPRHIVRLGLFGLVAHVIAVRFIEAPVRGPEMIPVLLRNPL